MKGNIFNIKKFAVHDGPGIRTTVFLNGCPLNCIWCHNPESQGAFNSGDAKNFKTIYEVIDVVEQDMVFFDESGGGVTLSGGEPLLQHKFVLDLLKCLKERDIHTVMDTTGYGTAQIFEEIAVHVDHFLYDLKIIDEKKHIEYTGVSNKLILDNFEYLDYIKKKTWVRFPLIPGMTDGDENIRRIGSLLKDKKNVERVSVLPFHSFGSHKYEKMKTEWKMGNVKSPDEEAVNRVCAMFEDYGLFTVKGG